MIIYDPREWTDSYVKYHENECVDILLRLTGGLRDLIRDGDYRSAAFICNGMCDGLSLMTKYDPNQYCPMLYGYSFILGELLLFGIGGRDGLRAAIPPLQDALDFARNCARPGRRTADRARQDAIKIENMLKDLSRGMSVDSVRRKYCPDFPQDILDEF